MANDADKPNSDSTIDPDRLDRFTVQGPLKLVKKAQPPDRLTWQPNQIQIVKEEGQ